MLASISMTISTAPVTIDDPVNVAILRISEDRVAGFQRDPLGIVARESGIELPVVIERIRAMLAAGTIRRVRQTLMTTNLAPGSLVAWEVSQERLHAAFDYMSEQDPFSGHVVVRTTDEATTGSKYRLWTTLKVPQGYSIEKHCDYLAAETGAERYRLMPAKRLFSLGVGHTRRRELTPGSRSDGPAEVKDTTIVELDELEWRVLLALKREFAPHEIEQEPWLPRAQEAGIPLERFYAVAERLNERGVIGRFSTFLEHVKPVAGASA